MTTEQEKIRTGGCQCGAVRFRIRGELGRPSICHCRMCQKQFGGFFGPLVTAKGETEWTREEPTYFQSSINIARGFCKQCGTPLTYKHPGGLEIAIGAFDDRSDLAPQIQVNFSARLPWVDIKVAQGLYINLDGEPLEGDDLHFKALPKALRVHLPVNSPLVVQADDLLAHGE